MNEFITALGRALGPGYRIERELGGGGMSRVFLTEELQLARRVVVKVLPPSVSATVDEQRFRREIAMAARWQHPHIVPLLAAGAGEGLLYYIMPFVEGESLEHRLSAHGALPLHDALRLLREVTDALAHAHAAGVVHRDIKPANVLLSGRHAFVVDFGVARALVSSGNEARAAADSTGRLTAVGMALGTPAYMAPEQALADPTADHRADLYALGVVAFETLTGELPFTARSAQALVAAHLTVPPPPLASKRPDLPASLTTLVDRLLAKDPDQRPPTADAVLQVLETLGTSGGITAEHDATRATPAPRSWRLPRFGSRARLGLGLLGVAGLVAFALTRPGLGVQELAASSDAREAIRRPLLVADFRAPGADSSLGAIAMEAVRTGLAQSSAVAVMSPADIGDALTRMKRPADAGLPIALARDVALREGVPLLVDGTITTVAGGYIVAVRLVKPEDGAEVVAFRATAENLRDLLPTIDRLTRDLRGRLGESLSSVEASPPLDRVTTASLPALRQYAAGMRALATGHLDDADRAFRSSLALDSTFAMAYRALGTTLIQRAASSVQIDSATEQAYRFRDRLPERERLLTIAAYFQGTQWAPARDRARSAEAYAGVLALAPNDPDALLDFAFQLRLRRDFRGADSLYRKAIAIRPQVSSIGALASALLAQQRPASADSIIADGRRRFPESGVDRWYRVVRLHEKGAYDSVTRMLDSLQRAPDANARLAAIVTQPDYLLFRGQLRAYDARLSEASAALERGGRSAIAVRNALSVATAFVFADSLPRRAIQRVDSVMSAPGWNALPPLAQAEATLQAAAVLARAGQTTRAAALVERVQRLDWTPTLRQSFSPMLQTAQGEIALADARADEALRLFTAADSLPDGPADDCQPCLAAQRARAFERLGKADSAIASYERYLATPDPYRLWYGTWWHLRDPLMAPLAHERLGALYAARGDATRSAYHDSVFVSVWSRADAPLQSRVLAAQRRLRARGGR